MKIAGLDVLIHDRPSPLQPGQTVPIVVLTVRTDQGPASTVFVSGPGPSAVVVARQLREHVEPIIIGMAALDIAAVWSALWRQRRRIGMGLIGAIDVALWDILGRVSGQPLHRLLGTARQSIPVYVSSWIHPRVEAYVEEALHYQAQGITAYKLHPPTQRRVMFGQDVDVAEDISALTAVREAVGPSMTLMNDSPNTYTYEEALRVGLAMQDLDYHWFEDPLPTDDIYGYTRLRQHLHIPLLATEMTDGGPYGYSEWIQARATDYLRGDVCLKGGVSALQRIGHTAEAFNLNLEVHDGFNAVNNMAGLGVVMSLRNTSFFEMLTIAPSGQYGFDGMSYGLTDEFTVASDGTIAAPQGPGIGATIDWDLILATATKVD